MLATPRQRLATIGGAVPHPIARPTGCPFHPRCPEVIAGRCDDGGAAAGAARPRRRVACFLRQDAGA